MFLFARLQNTVSPGIDGTLPVQKTNAERREFDSLIDELLFQAANTEHIVVYAKLQPYLAEMRELFGEPDHLENLEKLLLKIPDVESKLENRRKLMTRWAKAA